MPYYLSIENLTKKFPSHKKGEELTVFEGLNFGIHKGEFVCIIGHSGCGKSTILNNIAGLDGPSEGLIMMDNVKVSGPSLDRGVIFQNHSLLPWLSVLNNITLAVTARHPDWTKKKINEHAYKFIELVGLKGVENRKPSQLSGGMRQRVGIARALSIEPKVLLMDEPFGALDALTRGMIQDELIHICNQINQTIFMITHDIDEAILLSDRILLMTNGPYARIAESVQVNISRPRNRESIIHDPSYYSIRNHLVEFLVKRSKELSGSLNGIKKSETELERKSLNILEQTNSFDSSLKVI